MTLSVLEGHSPIASLKPFQVRFFVFVARRAVPLHLLSFLILSPVLGVCTVLDAGRYKTSTGGVTGYRSLTGSRSVVTITRGRGVNVSYL